MNRLFTKLRDFGLILTLPQENEEQIKLYSQAIREAKLPVALFHTDKSRSSLRLSSAHSDLFLGAYFNPTEEYEGEIKETFGAGGHFIFLASHNSEILEFCNEKGYETIVLISSLKEGIEAEKNGAQALLIDFDLDKGELLGEQLLEQGTLPLFFQGKWENLPLKRWPNEKRVVSYIVKDPFSGELTKNEIIVKTSSLIKEFLGLSPLSLTIDKDDQNRVLAKTYGALQSVPLFDGEKSELLIGCRRIDQTIAHLKWKEVYMDPFEALIVDDELIEAPLYDPFASWPVRLKRIP